VKKKVTITILMWFALLALSGCKAPTPSIVPSPQSTNPAPLYVHYTPPGELNIHLEFDYPSDWVLIETIEYASVDTTIVSLVDARSNALKTPAPLDEPLPPDDFGTVSITVEPLEPGHTPELEILTWKETYSGMSGRTVLSDYKTTIDGYEASVLEYQMEPTPEGYPSLMFVRRTVFAINEQLYTIFLVIAEKDRGGEFEQGYEYFFDSLKIVQ
jgi:hypothetical protein